MLSSGNPLLPPSVSGGRQENSSLGKSGPASGLWGFVCTEKSQAVSYSISDWILRAKDTEATPWLSWLM